MNRMPPLLLVLAALLFGGGAMPTSSAEPEFLLVDADQISTNRYLILTVPLDDADRLRKVAADIETQFNVTLTAEWPLLAISVHCLVVDASRHGDVDALVLRIRADQRIRTVQRMKGFETQSENYQDSLLPLQTAMYEMNAVRAHYKSTGAGIKIAVIDSGIDEHHPDLIGRRIEKRDFVSAAGDQAPEMHGTAIAGVIGADASNAQGMVGVAPEAKLLGLRACWQEAGELGRCSSFSLARALNFAILNQADVINLSLGGPPDPLLEELLLAAIESGVVIVAAWGKAERPAFPASVPGVIGAGLSHDQAIPAPAVDVISTALDGRYRYVSGSSVAAAHVTGVVALMLSAQADLTPGDVGRALNSAITLREGVPMLDACQALRSVRGSPDFCDR